MRERIRWARLWSIQRPLAAFRAVFSLRAPAAWPLCQTDRLSISLFYYAQSLSLFVSLAYAVAGYCPPTSWEYVGVRSILFCSFNSSHFCARAASTRSRNHRIMAAVARYIQGIPIPRCISTGQDNANATVLRRRRRQRASLPLDHMFLTNLSTLLYNVLNFIRKNTTI